MGARLICLLLAACLAGPAPAKAARGLRDLADRRGLLIGTAVRFYHLDGGTGELIQPFREDQEYTRRIAREFNVVTPENVMKMGFVHPWWQEFDFSDADELVDFAADRGIAVRGHALIWHHELPSWFSSGSWTRREVRRILKDHVRTVARHFRGRLYAWDVVNEAVSDETGELRETIWLTAGSDYIERAFRAARRADPHAVLCYNDYNHLDAAGWQRTKSDAVYSLVSRLVGEGVPIDCVGFQVHVDTDFRPADIASNFQRYADLGLEVHVTELDVRIEAPTTRADLLAQGRVYRTIMDACLDASNCTAFVMWGFTDRYSWIPEYLPGYGDGLILDAELRRKPAYRRLRKALKVR